MFVQFLSLISHHLKIKSDSECLAKSHNMSQERALYHDREAWPVVWARMELYVSEFPSLNSVGESRTFHGIWRQDGAACLLPYV